jgi:hypothetical protein
METGTGNGKRKGRELVGTVKDNWIHNQIRKFIAEVNETVGVVLADYDT